MEPRKAFLPHLIIRPYPSDIAMESFVGVSQDPCTLVLSHHRYYFDTSVLYSVMPSYVSRRDGRMLGQFIIDNGSITGCLFPVGCLSVLSVFASDMNCLPAAWLAIAIQPQTNILSQSPVLVSFIYCIPSSRAWCVALPQNA